MMVNKRKNLLMISLSSTLGGGTKHMFMLGKNLDSNFKIFYAIPKNYNFNEYLNSSNHLEISERKICIKDIIKLKRFAKLNSIDIIHAHGKGAGALARIIKIIINKPLIYTFHGIHLKCHSWYKRFIYIFYEYLFGWIDTKKILVSESEKNYAVKSKIFLGKKSIIINNGVSNMALKGSSESLSLNNHVYKFSKTNVISICRLVSQKNIKDILNIALYCPNLDFHILGDGPLREKIENRIKDDKIQNIYLLGKKKNVFKYLYTADIFLSTSFYEGLPISVLEAMSIGLPIVATNVIGNCDTIENGISGFLYELDDIKMAVNYLNQLDKNKKLRKKFGDLAFQRQRNLFSKELMLSRYKNLYKNVLNNF